MQELEDQVFFDHQGIFYVEADATISSHRACAKELCLPASGRWKN
jgi:hypothetical protein